MMKNGVPIGSGVSQSRCTLGTGRQQRARRLLAQHVIAALCVQQEGRVRLPPLELPHPQRAAVIVQMLREVAIERPFVEAMCLANLGELFGCLDHLGCQEPRISARSIRWQLDPNPVTRMEAVEASVDRRQRDL
jgi:hypothetical protein